VGTAQAPSPVCVFPQPDAAFTTDPEVPSLFAPQVLAEAVSDLPGWDRTWILDNTAVAEGTTFSFNALTAAPPPYPLCLRVVSEEGCVSQTCKNISPNEGWVVYAPNAFTPDMDGVNDAWRVEVTGIIDRYDLRVFDRWGREVFATQDPQQYWVGSVQDGAYFAPATVYTWRLEMAGRDVRGGTQVQVLEGHVSLLR
jgi:gliding motility-associated-like protein